MELSDYVRAARASRTAEDRLQLLIRLDKVEKTTLATQMAHEASVQQQAREVIECWIRQADTMARWLRERERIADLLAQGKRGR